MWPKSWFSSRRIRRLLGSYANARAADPAIDLPLIRKLQDTHRAISGNILSDTPLAFSGLDTDCVALKQHLQTAERLRASLVQLGEFAGDVSSVAASIASGLKGQINQPLVVAATDYLLRHGALHDAIGEFEAIAGRSLPDGDTDDFLEKLSQRMENLEQSRNLFRDWSSWCAIRARAVAQGLAPLVTDLESGAVAPDGALQAFRLGYARWWLPLAIDASRELRRFPEIRARTCDQRFPGDRRPRPRPCNRQGCEFAGPRLAFACVGPEKLRTRPPATSDRATKAEQLNSRYD
jgi:hypothetical protein